jgi:hypothetical protein
LTAFSDAASLKENGEDMMAKLWATLGASVCILVSVASGAHADLSGTISSSQEAAMEGVLVTARRNGSTNSPTVVTQKDGSFSLPEKIFPEKHTAFQFAR